MGFLDSYLSPIPTALAKKKLVKNMFIVLGGSILGRERHHALLRASLQKF